jgi:hypothetical protein
VSYQSVLNKAYYIINALVTVTDIGECEIECRIAVKWKKITVLAMGDTGNSLYFTGTYIWHLRYFCAVMWSFQRFLQFCGIQPLLPLATSKTKSEIGFQ